MYLEKITDSNSLRQLNISELNQLCAEIRKEIITVVSKNGGHLSSNLGSVELTVALFYVYDFPVDKMIFDVGHQSYAYKLLSARFDKFSTIRKEGGLSGFPDPTESQFDSFSAGHAGTSISAGLGYACSRDKLNESYNIINFVGDASIFNGENLEALSSCDKKPQKFLVVLNDNGMSINKNNNGFYKLISKITVTKKYNSFNNFLSKTIGNSWFGKLLKKFKRFLKRSISLNTLTDSLGLKYVGVFDGHDVEGLIKVLTNIKNSENPTILHVKTVKGKGYEIAEKKPSEYHGVTKNLCDSYHYFSSNVSNILEDIYKENDKIIAITAGMKDGVGLTEFANQHPECVIDVGIQEEHAVTYSAGLAISGTRPIVFIYSTFLQRSYDQIVHDVCLQNLPVIFCIDRAGVVGSDGKTHQGVFDISYLSHIPNMTIFAPKDAIELKNCILTALKLNSPVAIRYPNGDKFDFSSKTNIDEKLSWEVLTTGKKTAILAVGPRMLDLALKVSTLSSDVMVVNARVVKPLDVNLLNSLNGYNVITLEENAVIGGFGSEILRYINANEIKAKVRILGIKDNFISHSSQNVQLKNNGLTVEDILKII